MFNHHYPLLSDFYTVVLGFSIVILVCLVLFIQYLRMGLHSHDAVLVDSKAGAFAPNEKAKDGHHH